VVTENEAMRHVVDKLQCHVLGLRRQLFHAGLKPTVQLDEELLRPCPHKVSHTSNHQLCRNHSSSWPPCQAAAVARACSLSAFTFSAPVGPNQPAAHSGPWEASRKEAMQCYVQQSLSWAGA
jgi:hypothetical protein